MGLFIDTATAAQAGLLGKSRGKGVILVVRGFQFCSRICDTFSQPFFVSVRAYPN